MGGEGGGSTGSDSGSTAFSRVGSASQTSQYSLPAALSSLLTSSMNNYGGADDASRTYLHRVVNQDATIPGLTNLGTVANGLNPLSTEYETDSQSNFDNRIQKLLAVSRTGIENANAPLNRGKEFREAEVINQGARDRETELRQNRLTDFGMLQGANQAIVGQSNQAADILQRLKTANTGSAAILSELLGSKSGVNSENFNGQGAQSNTAYSMGGGIGFNACCFIFLEAYRGKMPWWVRDCRDEFVTPHRRDGYRWMSTWLVPAMKRSAVVRALVWKLMIQPLTRWGGWYKKVEGYEHYSYLKPVVDGWFKVWELIGRRLS